MFGLVDVFDVDWEKERREFSLHQSVDQSSITAKLNAEIFFKIQSLFIGNSIVSIYLAFM